MQELIIIKQLPIIEENLKSLSEDIDKKVENAKALVCDDKTVKEVKKLRAEFNKEFKELETQRKLVKTEVEKPYKEFEEIYKKYISDKFKLADTELSNKINEVESELKHEKEVEVKEYFEELKEAVGIYFVDFSDSNIIVNLTASMKSLKTQCKEFIDRVVEDLKTIKTQEHADEIEVEYRKTLNLNKAIQEMNDRHLMLEAMQKVKESTKETVELEEKTVEKVDEVLAAPEVIDGQMSIDDFEEQIEDEIIEIEIRLKATVKNMPTDTIKMIGKKTDLKIFIQCLNEGGYEYE